VTAARQGPIGRDADYDTDTWFARAKGMKCGPERGIRCLESIQV
jgi:predicted adenine nucleotide alpha hydrolase (AANH) superfamily ATPase